MVKKQRTTNQLLLGQFFTPQEIAEYMARMFDAFPEKATILDAGAGEGALGISLIRYLSDHGSSIDASFVEFDEETAITLKGNLLPFTKQHDIRMLTGDFIELGLSHELNTKKYSHIIINPPYFKIRTDSPSSKLMRANGISVTNIYAAFMWLSLSLLAEKGELVAIVPRSFCNGTYFAKFRQFITGGYSIDKIHTFEHRNKAFSSDSVLQENIIIKISKTKQKKNILLSYSDDGQMRNSTTRTVPSSEIFSQDDKERIIHIPGKSQTFALHSILSNNLEDIGIKVSTGPIVDFRAKDRISTDASKDAVPLLYPQHFRKGFAEWPIADLRKKGQYIKPESEKDVLPLDGAYVLVRRFSSKEEKRRVFASVLTPKHINTRAVAFENHLNYFHMDKHGFDTDLAYGLSTYLNSSLLDEHFRKMSGHTQVNVGDLKKLPYPSVQQLKKIGMMIQEAKSMSESDITKKVLGVKE